MRRIRVRWAAMAAAGMSPWLYGGCMFNITPPQIEGTLVGGLAGLVLNAFGSLTGAAGAGAA